MLAGPDHSERGEVFAAAESYYANRKSPPFVPGKTFIPASGKVLDFADLANLLDASLDMWLTAGRYAREFEKQIGNRMGLRHARLTVSGSAANLLAFSALTSWKLGPKRIAPGSEIITVAAGFPTTIAPIIQNRCIPVFVDVDPATGNVDPALIEAAISDKTRGIMIAHTLGNPFDLGAVTKICAEHNLYLVEDCCDALGADYDDKPVGTFGDLATVSFYPAHHITTGEGGVIATNKGSLAKLVESFRDWGRDCWCGPGEQNTCGNRFSQQLGDLPLGYDHKFTYSHIGYNMKMSDMQAAVGLSQLAKLDQFVEARRRNHAFLKQAFLDAGLDEYFHLHEPTPSSNPSWFGFLMCIRDGVPLARRNLIEYLEENAVGTRLLFAGNVIRQPAFSRGDVSYRVVGSLDNTDLMMNNAFWIGVWPGISEIGLEYMVETLKAGVRRELGK